MPVIPAPVIVGAVFTEVVTTVVVLSTITSLPPLTVNLKVVDSVSPTEIRLGVGVNLIARRVDCTLLALPVMEVLDKTPWLFGSAVIVISIPS